MNKPTVRQAILHARQILVESGIEDASFNADLMAATLLGVDNGRLPLLWPDEADQAFIEKLQGMVNRRCRHEPLQYIIGSWGFLDFQVKVATGALIPRPETEEVFIAATRAIDKAGFSGQFRFADVGTGTGILGLAMARRYGGAEGWLVDLSTDALAVARQNLSQFSELACRISLLQSDLLSSFARASLQVIISNPPYVNSSDIPGLMPEVARHEPHMALDGGGNGLDLIFRLLRQAADVLVDGGVIIIEHGHGQRGDIVAGLTSDWKLAVAGDDLCGCERFIILQRETNR